MERLPICKRSDADTLALNEGLQPRTEAGPRQLQRDVRPRACYTSVIGPGSDVMIRKAISYTPYYGACIALASMLWRSPMVLVAGFLALSTLMLWRWHRTDDLIFYFLPFFLGPVGEMVAIYHGAWRYSQPFLLIPIWLPFAWGCAALYMKKTADVLLARRRRSASSVDDRSRYQFD